MAGTWKDLTHQPGVSIDTMLLLTDGTVMAHELASPKWHRLTPDANGSYLNGTWAAMPPMPPNSDIPAGQNGPDYGPVFYGSAVLRDGTLLVAGGEYNIAYPGAGVDSYAATRFDPVGGSWTNLVPPAGWSNVGDVPLCVLQDGRVLLGFIYGNQTSLFDPITGTFSPGPDKGDSSSEESFAILPDGTVLAVQCSNIGFAEKYVPSTDSWVPAGATPSTLPQSCPGYVAEIGPTVVLPNGTAFVIGASGNTAIYVPPADPADTGNWLPGPDIKDTAGNTMYPMDAPAALLPNGKVLLAAGPGAPCGYPPPTSFFEYDPATNNITPAATPSNAGGPCFTGRLLVVPNGHVLFSSQSGTVALYNPGGSPDPSWRPVVTSVPPIMAVGHHYLVSGQQFNGLSQACYYGDDATMATNYPIARLKKGAKEWYCRTAHHSTMGIATGSTTVTTVVSIPAAMPPGDYQFHIIANGIESLGVPVKIVPTMAAIAVDIQDGGNFGTVCGGSYLALHVFSVGNADLIVDKVFALPPGGNFFVLPMPATPLTIGPGDQVDFTVMFTPGAPSTVDAGAVVIASNDPLQPWLQIPVTAATGTGSLTTAIADSGDFGNVCRGHFADLPLTLNNSGTCPLRVTAITSSSADFLVPSVVSYPLVIADGGSAEVSIRFQPTGIGPHAGTIQVDSSDPASPLLIPVSGSTPAGQLAVSGSLHFGQVDCGKAQRTLSVCNVGPCDLHVASVAFKHPRKHFEIVSNPFPATLAPGSCLGVVVQYEANCEPESCELVITSDDPTDPVKVVDVVAFTCCRPCPPGGCDERPCRCEPCGCEPCSCHVRTR
jgi:hypothetical protein